MGLARLVAAGFPVPPGICLTTMAYQKYLQAAGRSPEEDWRKVVMLSGTELEQALFDCRARIQAVDFSDLALQWRTALQGLCILPSSRWAVRSSATNEDAGSRSFAGLYRTHLGVSSAEIDRAVRDLWASLWREQVVQYSARDRDSHHVPAMAVVIQPMLNARASGVAYSIHPVTGRSCYVVVNAVPGLAAPLVEGQVAPDQYTVEVGADRQPIRVRRRTIGLKSRRLVLTEAGLCTEAIPEDGRQLSSLDDQQLLDLGRTTKQVEQTFRHPVDIEWAIDGQGLWLLQARPITGVGPTSELTNDDCEWSRTNFKETMPELPSPLGLSFLQQFMEAYIIKPYRRLGCQIPAGLSAARVFHGRPYLNVTLFHSLVAQLRGDASLMSEQMGGEPIAVTPFVRPIGWLAFLRAGVLMLFEMRRASLYAPAWFAEMKAMAKRLGPDQVESLSFQEASERLDALGRWLDEREVTFAIAGGVAQCLQALSALLPRWLGPEWRALLNAAVQGQGTVISAQQILRLAGLSDIARKDPVTRAMLTSTDWNPSEFRTALKGTEFLREFNAYVEDYGHRGLGESDVMSPRMADNPEAILCILRTQVSSAVPEREAILSRQESTRASAMNEIHRRLGWRLHRRVVFSWWYRRLCRFFALREANRHHLMYYSMAARNLLLRLGTILVERGDFTDREDIFFLTLVEQKGLTAGESQDWRGVIHARRADRARHAAVEVPDTIRDWETAREILGPSGRQDRTGPLSGMPVSAGSVTGPIRLIRSVTEWSKLKAGDIIVAPVIDPGMAPLFGIAGGLIAEMGGTLSHGAIIAREYGLPTVVNVEGALSRLRDGQKVTMDAGKGTIHFAEVSSDSSSLAKMSRAD